MSAQQGDQRRAAGAKDCFPSLIDSSVSKDEHYAAAQKVTIPWSRKGGTDYDLQLAAQDTTKHIKTLSRHRHEAMEAFTAQAKRCEPLAEALRHRQCITVNRVAGCLNLGLVAVLRVIAKCQM